MSGTGAVIDLGVYTRESAAESAPPAPWFTRTRLVRWRRRAVAVLIVAMVTPLAGAAPAPAAPLSLLWTVPGGPYEGYEVTVGDRDAYVVTRTGGGYALTAYRLADGAPRWSAPLEMQAAPQVPAVPRVTLVDGLPVVYSFGRVGRTVAYDLKTAEVRWTSQGFPAYVGSGRVALAIPSFDGEEAGTVTLELRDASSGAVAVSVESQWIGYGEARDETALAFTLDQAGRLSSYDIATGALVRAAPTRFRPGGGRPGSVSVAGGVVLVAGEIGIDDTLVAYDLDTLEPLWSLPDETRTVPCGPVVCLGAFEGTLRGMDPRTGTEQWAMSCADAGAADDCAMFGWELGTGDRLLVEPQGAEQRGGEPMRRMIVDAATGRVVAGPTRWDISAEDGGSLLLSRGEGVPSDGTEYRRDEDIVPHRVWWARSDLDLARIEIIGEIEADWCSARDPYLVCYTPEARAEIWRIK